MEFECIKIAYFYHGRVTDTHVRENMVVVKDGPMRTALNGSTFEWKGDKLYTYNAKTKLSQIIDQSVFSRQIRRHTKVKIPEDGKKRTLDHDTQEFVEHRSKDM